MATISFDRDWTLTHEQLERLVEILDEPGVTISDEQARQAMRELEEGESLLKQLFGDSAHSKSM